MTAYLTLADGSVWRLPMLLAWQYRRTDGSSCDDARVEFVPEAGRKKQLCTARLLRLEEGGKTVFFGPVDEVRVTLDGQGHRAELLARGFMALLMEHQLRETVSTVFSAPDAAGLARQAGVEKVQTGNLSPVRNFSWGTGTTAWAAISGYCRHAGARPRFLADGTLLLDGGTGGLWRLGENCPVEQAEFRLRRCGATLEQTAVRSGSVTETAVSGPAKQLGITARQVFAETGKTLRASWRTARQRLEDSARDAVVLEITLPQACPAEPGDTVELSLPGLVGGQGRYRLRSLSCGFTQQGRQTVLELEGGLADVAG